jgi:hypothetical protein
MKQGKSLVDLAKEIERQSLNKVDVVADTRGIQIMKEAETNNVQLVMTDNTVPVSKSAVIASIDSKTHIHGINDIAHRQIAERVGIPQKYYQRMLAEQPELLATNVNKWFQAQPERRLVRLLDGNVRAFLSDRYQRIDNWDVAQTVLPILLGTDGIECLSQEITDSRLYIKAVTHKVQGEIKSKRVGDVVEAGVMITNSEVGMGAISIKPFVHFLVCTNGMVRDKDSLRRAHIGRQIEGDNVVNFLTDETRKAEDHAVLLKVRDVVTAAMNPENFRRMLDEIQLTTEQRIEGNPVESIKVLSNQFGLVENESNNILRHLIEGADLSRYGMMNAITRASADIESYDRATELETMGGALLDLPRADWHRIAIAA